MKRTITFICIAAALALSTAPAFALSSTPNCSSLQRGWVACVFESARETGG